MKAQGFYKPLPITSNEALIDLTLPACRVPGSTATSDIESRSVDERIYDWCPALLISLSAAAARLDLTAQSRSGADRVQPFFRSSQPSIVSRSGWSTSACCDACLYPDETGQPVQLLEQVSQLENYPIVARLTS
jgi:hypothetical protein